MSGGWARKAQNEMGAWRDQPLRVGSNAGLARNTLTDAAKWNHNGFIMDGECRAHNFDTEEYS